MFVRGNRVAYGYSTEPGQRVPEQVAGKSYLILTLLNSDGYQWFIALSAIVLVRKGCQMSHQDGRVREASGPAIIISG